MGTQSTANKLGNGGGVVQDKLPDALGVKELRAQLMMDLDEPSQAEELYRCPTRPHLGFSYDMCL